MINEKTMLTTISWSSYITAITVLLLCWYLFLGLRFYKTEFKKLFSGDLEIKFPPRERNLPQSVFGQITEGDLPIPGLSGSLRESSSTTEDAEELAVRLITAVAEHSQDNLSEQEFTNYLKLILSEYPFVKNSSLRARISKLLAAECQKHPQLGMTSAQADALWDTAVQ
jgi:hypothetical protein